MVAARAAAGLARAVTNAAEMLARLRGVPPIGSWVAVPDELTRPDSGGFVTRRDAEAEARRLGHPFVAKVVASPNGWTVGDLFQVEP